MIHSRYRLLSITGAAVLAVASLSGASAAGQPNLPAPGRSVPVCPGPAAPGNARCHARVRVDVMPNATNPAGYHPADLQSAYKLPSVTAGNAQTVGIVDAFDDPNAESDLAVYRSTFGLPPCTTANGCF